MFGYIYQINPHEVLHGNHCLEHTDLVENFSFERAEMVNRTALERVTAWQLLDSIPVGHSISLMDVGKSVLKGIIGAIDNPGPIVIADTEHLVQQVQELQNEERRLRSDFPAAAKVMEPDGDESGSTDNEGNGENEHESESSGILVEKHECSSPGSDRPAKAAGKFLEAITTEKPEEETRGFGDTQSSTCEIADSGA